jgi:hypothetical protein
VLKQINTSVSHCKAILTFAKLEIGPVISLDNALQQRVLPKVPALLARVRVIGQRHITVTSGVNLQLVSRPFRVIVNHVAWMLWNTKGLRIRL